MTMLDWMRRHKGILKWSLFIVVVAFVVLYIPSFLDNSTPGTAADADVVASVNGQTVTAGEYRQLYEQQLESLRQTYGGIDEKTLQQLGIGQRIISQLVNEAAMLAEAKRLGVGVSDAELRERLLRLPGFQQNGQFVGDAMYRQILEAQRPPLRPAEFEAELRKELTAEKLQAAVTSWIHVSDADVDAEYRRRNEKVKLDFVSLTANQFRAGIAPTDAEIAARFDANKSAYKIPEKRRVKFLSIDAQALQAQMTVTPQEVEARYNANKASYSTPEQIQASHILFKTDGKNDAAQKKLAESVLAKIKAGGDFAALAKQYSDDTDSKAKGGDLGYFGHGTMVKEFEDAAFALQPGQVSDLVKSQYGYHIIKVTGKKAAATKTLDDVRAQITSQIKAEKAQTQAKQTADAMAKEIQKPADLDRVAKEHGLTVGDSGLFARDEPLAGLGFAPDVAAEAFTMQQDAVSGEIQTDHGFAFIALTQIQPSYVPKLDEVKDKVREDVIKAKAMDLAKAKAAALAEAARKVGFAAAAKAAGAPVRNTDFIARGASLPDVGVSGAVDNAVFALKPGDISSPIVTDNAIVVADVKDRQDVTADQLAKGRDDLRTELLQQRRQDFFTAYMTKVKTGMKIQYNDNAIKTLLAAN